MFDYRGLQDGLFIALYCMAGCVALIACLYLLFRRRNLFMRESTSDEGRMVLAPSGEAVRLGHALRASRRLRRWAAGVLLAAAASQAMVLLALGAVEATFLILKPLKTM